MNSVRLKVIFIVFVGSVLATGCSKFRKIQKSEDWMVKYQAAVDYFENSDYHRALILFEEILPLVRGTKEAEQVQFYYAYCHYYQKDYIMSSHYFKRFYETFGRSQYAQEANYLYAYSLYKDSPVYSLDQSVSVEAIAAMQNFINRYPSSEYAEQASGIINELQQKLEKKAYENAKLYYKIGVYKSAIVAFKNFSRDFPDSKYNVEIQYLKIDASFQYAKFSIRNKQEERYRDTIGHYEFYVDKFPESRYLKAAEGVYENCKKELSKLNN